MGQENSNECGSARRNILLALLGATGLALAIVGAYNLLAEPN